MSDASESVGHVHRFDPFSGWCGCGYRDDGRLTHHGSVWHEGRQYTAAELHEMLTRGIHGTRNS